VYHDKGLKPDRPPMETREFIQRIINSRSLVIGADMKTSTDIDDWSKLDPNYIGIRDWDTTWSRYNEDKWMDWNDEYIEEKYPDGKPEKTFAELVDYVFSGKIIDGNPNRIISEHKFKLIIVDGGTTQYIYDMETLYRLAEKYMDKDIGLLIYPVSRKNKGFPNFLLGFLGAGNIPDSFSCYNVELEDIPKYIAHNLHLIGFVNVETIGLCYIMKHKSGKILRDEGLNYSIIKKLRDIKARSTFFMNITENLRIIRQNSMKEWLRIKSKFLDLLIPVQPIDNPIWERIKANKGVELKREEKEFLRSNPYLKNSIDDWVFLENNPMPTTEYLAELKKILHDSKQQTEEQKEILTKFPRVLENIKTWERIKNATRQNITDEEWEFLYTNSKFPTDLTSIDIRSLLKTAYDLRVAESSGDFTGPLTLTQEQCIEKILKGIKEENDAEAAIFKQIQTIDIETDIKGFLRDPNTSRFFQNLLREYNHQQEKQEELEKLANIQDNQSACYMNEPCEDPAGDRQESPHSPESIPVPDSPKSTRSGFKRKSGRKPKCKSKSKSGRKSNSKSKRKSGRKSNSKSKRKSGRKSNSKSKRKSGRKPVRKSVRKSNRRLVCKSKRKPLRKSVRKSKRKSRQ